MSTTYTGYRLPEGKCGQCKFFVRWSDPDQSWRSGTYCGFKAPRVAGLDGWGEAIPKCTEEHEACSMFENVQPVATKGRNIRLEDDDGGA